MKIIANVENKTLRILENERSIFRGEYGADKLELYINKQLINEYPTITALLSNGRKIGPYSTDEAYTTEIIDNVTYTKANFTLSKANGFTLSEGKMMITIWMNSNGKKEALGNITLNVINTTAFDDGDIIISGDVEGTIVNIKVELENLQSQVNTFNGRITNVERDILYISENVERLFDETIPNLENNKANKTDVATELAGLEHRVDVRFNQLIGEGASETLDTIGEISKALEEHNTEYDSLLAVVGNKVDKATYEAHLNDYRSVVSSVNELGKNKADKKDIPTKVSQLEQDIAVGGGVSEEQVMEIIEENSEQVGEYNIGTSVSYDETSDNEVPTTKAVNTMFGKAKLVAKAIPVPTIEDDVEFYEGYFETDIPLKANKIYLLEYYSENFMTYSTAIVTTYLFNIDGSIRSSRSVLACYESFNDNPVPAVIIASENAITIYAINGYLPFPDDNGEIPNLVFEPNDYIEIYELSFTLGGE